MPSLNKPLLNTYNVPVLYKLLRIQHEQGIFISLMSEETGNKMPLITV